MFPLLLLAACGPRVALTPEAGSSFGHFEVEVDLARAGVDAAEVTGARLGGVRGLALTAPDAQTLAFTVQGAPEAGPVGLVLETPAGEHVFPDAFSYDEPVDPVFARTWALGASLSQGVRAGVPSARGALGAGPALVARQAGAYLGLPLLVDHLFVPIGPADVGPAPGCAFRSYAEHGMAQVGDVVGAMTGEDGFDYALGRLDAAVEVRDVAVAGATVRQHLENPGPSDPAELILAHLVHEPAGALLDPIEAAQLDRVEAGGPTLVLALDSLGNDLIDPILADTIDPSLALPAEALRPDLEELLGRLAATGAEVFVGDAPAPCALPLAEDKARAMREAGADEAEIEAACEALAEVAADYSALLTELAAAWPNVRVVPYRAAVAQIAADGVEVGGERLTTRRFGGLVGLDGLHFTATGYAIMANLALDAVESELGVAVERVDLAAVHAADPESPAALLAAGLDPACAP